MKKTLMMAFVAASILVSCKKESDQTTTKETQEVAAQAGASYTIDEAASKISWKAYHKGGLNPRFGTLKGSGTLSAEADKLTSGSVEFDIKSLTTDPKAVDAAASEGKTSVDLDGHLKSPDFFDAEKFPTAKFEISSVAAFDPAKDKSALPDANAVVSGNLTLKDKTVNITFPAKVSVSGEELSLQSKFTINRQEWGLAYGAEGDPKDWMISPDIDIELDVKAKK